MKKIFSATVAIGMALFAGNALAAPAIILTDFGCAILDGDGGTTFTTDTTVVSSQNANGNVTFKCKIKGVANSTGQAVRWDFDNTGLPCGTQFGSTNDWHETVSASGNATLICKLP